MARRSGGFGKLFVLILLFGVIIGALYLGSLPKQGEEPSDVPPLRFNDPASLQARVDRAMDRTREELGKLRDLSDTPENAALKARASELLGQLEAVSEENRARVLSSLKDFLKQGRESIADDAAESQDEGFVADAKGGLEESLEALEREIEELEPVPPTPLPGEVLLNQPTQGVPTH